VNEYLIAYALFLAAHSLPAMRPLRRRLVTTLGEKAYVRIYGFASLALLVWLISAALRAPYIALWTPPGWAYLATLILAPLGLVLVGAGLARPNPLSVSLSRSPFDPARPGIVAITRHPVLWGFALWALSHLPANGDVVATTLFGGLGAFALLGLPLVDRRVKGRLGAAAWLQLASSTSILLFAAMARGRAPVGCSRSDLIGAAAGGATAALLLVGLHAALFGADPLAVFGHG
jgi:uncharacterized membrane protein